MHQNRNLPRWLPAALCGAALAALASFNPALYGQATNPAPSTPPTTSAALLEWNMDDKPMWGAGWGGYNWSANAYLPTFSYDIGAAGYGVSGSKAWYLAMDNRTLAAPNTPDWAGGGTGCSGPVDLRRFDTADLTSYRLSFDARAQGLNVNRTIPTTGRLQVFLDSSLGNAGNSRLDFSIPAGSNWVTATYLLSEGSFGIGSAAALATNYTTLTGIHMQMQIENANSEADWGFDNDNVLVIDNLKLERLYAACPPLTLAISGKSTVVQWLAPSTGIAKLQSAPDPSGPWSDVTDASSPYNVPTSGAPKFFRTLWVSPTQ